MDIRRADLGDKYEIVDMLREFDLFANGREFYFGDHAEGWVEASISSPNYVWFVAEENHKVVGIIAGFIGPHFMNPSKTCLSEMLWWVLPERRNSSAGSRLFHAFMKYGEEHADMVVMTLEHNSPVKDSYFERQGFKCKEKSFVKEMR